MGYIGLGGLGLVGLRGLVLMRKCRSVCAATWKQEQQAV